MMQPTTPPAAESRPGFLRNGWREISRKVERRRLRGQLAQQDRERVGALARLGQRAWEEKIDLAPFPDLCAELERLHSRAGELSATARTLEAEKATFEDQRRTEAARFDADRRRAEEEKRPVDEALRAAGQRRTDLENTIRRQEARLTSLPQELAMLEKHQVQLAVNAATDRDAKRQELEAEKTRLEKQVAAARAALPGLRSEVDRLNAESQRYAAETSRIEGERATAIATLDSELSRVGGQLTAMAREAGAVEQQRTERFTQLGLGLYDRKSLEPALTDGIREITAIDEKRAATQAALQASLAQTQAIPSGTMLKFTAVMLLVPLLFVGLGYGAYWGWTWWQQRQPVDEVEINPYLSHPLNKEPPYLLADRLWAAQDESTATGALLELFRAIGLGVYRPDGSPVLAGSERGPDDFYLYDFQVGILARALIRRNGTPFHEYANALEQNVKLASDTTEIPLSRGLLVEGLHRRYQQAVAQPRDPYSFLPLAIDGLARQHSISTSLLEFYRDPGDDFVLDPVQTFLLSLDLFVHPKKREEQSPAQAWTPLARSLLSWLDPPQVYAASPRCDKILGDPQKESYWGTFLDSLGELLKSLGLEGKVSSKIAKGLGGLNKGTDVAQLAILKYGITLNVTAEPPKLHLHHTGSAWEQIKLTARVEFDPGKIPEGVIKCGWLTGASIPRPGPVPDVTVEWDFQPSPAGVFEAHPKTLQAGRQVGTLQKTDSQGKSEYLLLPLYCKDKKGRVRGRNFRATVSAQILSAGPTAGLDIISGGTEYIFHWFGGLFTAETRFRGEWHEKKPREPQY